MSSLILYMEMADAHANPKAKLVTRVPNMTLFSFSSQGNWRPSTGQRTRLGVMTRATFGESVASARSSVGRSEGVERSDEAPASGSPRRAQIEPRARPGIFFFDTTHVRASRLDSWGVVAHGEPA